VERINVGVIDYKLILAGAWNHADKSMTEFLSEALPSVWCEAYKKMSPRDTYILRVQHNTFNFIYDAYRVLEVTGVVPEDPIKESRLVAVLGTSEPSRKARDDYRLKGWIGPTERTYGRRWDKGHLLQIRLAGRLIDWR
jgi:hypothetical protein